MILPYDNYDAISRQAAINAGASGQLRHWELNEFTLLALLILLDQYPRVLYRASPAAYKYDAVVREVVLRAIKSGVRC